ncbi:hypothetical protein MU1_35420 [Paenibacillus glycanilyticus]|uniref:Uncharacterized protein n=1 Tax=Paenibacillus glycanilyticus TaxID=126569 RepID=A0ABQ6GHU0_9BACL|nr:hypothetical protein MU1_35420 [Paenibacillus glycanilyticus]
MTGYLRMIYKISASLDQKYDHLQGGTMDLTADVYIDVQGQRDEAIAAHPFVAVMRLA